MASRRSPVQEFFIWLFLLSPAILVVLGVGYFAKEIIDAVRFDIDARSFRPVPQENGEFLYKHNWWTIADPYSLPRPQGFALTLYVGFDHLAWMSDAYGIPVEWSPRSWPYRGDALDRRGIKVTKRSNRELVASPDYPWIIESSEPVSLAIASAIQHSLQVRGLKSQRGLWCVVASFVQSIEYSIPNRIRHGRSGSEYETLGVITPVEILYNEWADCDSKCVLFAAVLKQFPLEHLLLLKGRDHGLVGVRGIPRGSDRYVVAKGIPYVLIELTGPFAIGALPSSLWDHIRDGDFALEDL